MKHVIKDFSKICHRYGKYKSQNNSEITNGSETTSKDQRN